MASIMDLQKLQEILNQLERLTLNRKDDVAGFIKAMKNCSQAEYESLIKFVHRGIGYEAEWCNQRNDKESTY